MVEFFKIARLHDDNDDKFKIIVVDEELPKINLLKIDVLGTEIALKTFYDDYCSECAVCNNSIELRPLNKNDSELLKMDCIIDNNDRKMRLCNLNESLGSAIVSENKYNLITMNMEYDPNLDMVFRIDEKNVVIFAKGQDIESFWRVNCVDCEANPNFEAVLPVFKNEDSTKFCCRPIKGVRNCD